MKKFPTVKENKVKTRKLKEDQKFSDPKSNVNQVFFKMKKKSSKPLTEIQLSHNLIKYSTVALRKCKDIFIADLLLFFCS